MEYLIAKVQNQLVASHKAGSGFYRREVADGPFPLKAKGRTVTGLCSVFGSDDQIGDIVVPGAFKRSIELFNSKQSRCRFLWNHEQTEPPTAEILEIKELSQSQLPAQYQALPNVSGALQVTRKYFAGDPYTERIFQGVVSGAIGEMSFAYNIVRFRYKEVGGVKFRLLDELELFDISDVNFGCHPDTSAAIKGPQVRNAAKATAEKELEKQRRAVRDLVATSDFISGTGPTPEADWLWMQSAKKDAAKLFGSNHFREVSSQLRSPFGSGSLPHLNVRHLLEINRWIVTAAE